MSRLNEHTIWVVEDDGRFRQSLAELIEQEPGLSLTKSVDSVEKALKLLDVQEAPAVILQDIGMPGISGIDAIPHYKKAFPDTEVIIITIFEDEEKVFQAIQYGASGYLLKRSTGDKIIQGIREVLEGGAPISPGIAKKVMQMMLTGAPKKESVLTKRETEILRLLVDGCTMDMVSMELTISSFTVDTHIKNIYKKLQVHNRAEVVAKALKNRLI